MLKKLLSKIFRFNQQMQTKIEWQQTDEPILFSWTARGRVGNKREILLGKLGFAGIILLFGIFPTTLLLIAAKDQLDIIGIMCIGGIMAGPIIFMSYFYTVGGEFYTYRITKESIELASWNEGLPKFKEIMQIFLCVVFLFLVFIFITDPAILLISLGGMVGVGLIAGATLFSKSYLETHLKYKHLFTYLNTVEELKIDNSRKLILLVAKSFNRRKQRSKLFNLFCTEENFNQLVQLVTEKATINHIEVVYGRAYEPD
ncbi:hypothetical protein MTZ49_08735 [Entomomonas sp. E2T0]|uniref:hypothetical protein n=1 Tax=Entomomonas sp. E2T0 TaxID=2930213 RepID=UPI0022283B23|nr:hypothetical protein [Entomomonas sp. E2T0]UYZ82702.1 hypothetical protein MTZ49_08735 [Entomomonas sp. E2T0]